MKANEAKKLTDEKLISGEIFTKTMETCFSMINYAIKEGHTTANLIIHRKFIDLVTAKLKELGYSIVKTIEYGSEIIVIISWE